MALGHTMRSALRRGRELRRLQSSGEDGARLAAAIRRAQGQVVSPSEREWLERLEALRCTLDASTAELRVVDYGAGSRYRNAGAEPGGSGDVVVKSVQDACRTALPFFWSSLLFGVVRAFAPSTALELGSGVGISAAFQSAALRLNGTGELVTLEGADALAALAARNLLALGLDNARVVPGRFQDTLGSVLDRHRPVDHVFIDGHHDERATVEYFERILPALSERAVVVVDDIAWSDGMRRAWSAIEADARVRTSIDLGRIGILLVRAEPGHRSAFTIAL